jgi:GxxExxY protein
MNNLTGEVIAAAIEVHKILGPGLLESTYEECLCRELGLRKISFERQKTLPIDTKALRWIVAIVSTSS